MARELTPLASDRLLLRTDRSDREPTGTPGNPRSASWAPAGLRKEGDGKRHEVLISVAKRLVRSAVRRNTVKRIVREAWREATRNEASRNASGSDRGTQYLTP